MRRLIDNLLPDTAGYVLVAPIVLPIVFLILTLLAQPAKANDIYGNDNWSYTYKEGYYWYAGVPYEKVAYTGYRYEQQCIYGCYKQVKVPYTYYKYRKVATLTEYKDPESFEKLIDKFADMKREIIRTQDGIQKMRAYRLEAAQALKDFQLDGLALPQYAENLRYEEYQYPAEVGTTNYGYGVREYMGLSYGGSLQQLDVDRVLQDSYQYEKLSEENASRRKETLDLAAKEIDATRTHAIADVQKIQAVGDVFDSMLSRMERMTQRLEVYERELIPYGEGEARQPIPLPQVGGATIGAIFASKCGKCHIDDQQGKLSLAEFSKLPEKRRKVIYLRTHGKGGGNPMPPADEPQLTEAEKEAISVWYTSSIR